MQSYGFFVPSILVRDPVSWGKNQIIEQESYSGLPVCVCTLTRVHTHTHTIER